MAGHIAPNSERRGAGTGLRLGLGLLTVGLSFLLACGEDEPPGITGPQDRTAGIPDAIAVIAEREFLLAWRNGVLQHDVDGNITAVEGIPESRTVDVYGGLLEVALHPDFQNNRLVYIAYNDAGFGLAVARFEFRDDRALNLEVIYESNEFSIGSRIAWEDASHFFLSFGIGGSPYPDPGPQDLHRDVGKIHRLTADGRIPSDNPVFSGAAAPTTVWSYGHRNPQGLFYDAVGQTLYEVEHGPMGGDELNLITPGGNYGWPLFSHGLNYDGTAVSNMTEQDAAAISILPIKVWGPDFRVAPSGLLRIDNQIPAWSGSFLIGALNPQHLLRYDPATDETEVVLARVGRVRDIAQLPSGTFLISVDAGSPRLTDAGRIITLPGLP